MDVAVQPGCYDPVETRWLSHREPGRTSPDHSDPAGTTGDVIAHMLRYLQRLFALRDLTAIEVELPSRRPTVIASTGGHADKAIEHGIAILAHGNLAGTAHVTEVERCKVPDSDVPALVFRVTVSAETVVLVAATPRPGAPGPGPADETAARDIAEWVGCCVRLSYAFRDERARTLSLSAAFDLLATGVIVVDRSGQLSAANHSAKNILADGGGLCLQSDRLRAATLDDSARLQTAIHKAAEGDEDGLDQHRAGLLLIRRHRRRPLAVAVKRGSPQPGGQHSVVILVVDPERDISRSIAPLCDLYGFTAAEARLINLLVSGLSVNEAATRLHIQPLTARTHLKRMFEKTNTHRQSALIHLLLTSIVRTASDLELQAV